MEKRDKKEKERESLSERESEKVMIRTNLDEILVDRQPVLSKSAAELYYIRR